MSSKTVGRPMEILLVEDGLIDARVTIANLERGHVQHRLTLVRDGVEAMDFLQRRGIFARAPRPDLILLDLELPKKDGREVLAEIKADNDLQNIPVVILSASDDPEDIFKSQLLGVDSYITKPVNLEKFLAVIKELRSFWRADLLLPNVQ